MEKATIQARLLSRRYRVESLSGHWIPSNREGVCTLPGCWRTPVAHRGTVECFLLSCPSLSVTRQALLESTYRYLLDNPLLPLVQECLGCHPVLFWLDCTTMPSVIRASQAYVGDSVIFILMKLTRNYCHGLHKARMSLLESV